MKYQHKFDHCRKAWDRHKAFHTTEYAHPFVRFETGELMLKTAQWSPAQRRTYPEYNVALTSSADREYRFTTPDAEPVPTAWLTADPLRQPRTPLVIDLDGRRAYAPVRSRDKANALPTHLWGSVLYWPNEHATPLAGAAVRLAKPNNAFRAEHRRWMEEVRSVCAAIQRISGTTTRSKHAHILSVNDVEKSVTEYTAGLTPHHIDLIAANGFYLARVVTEVPYLLVKE